MFLKCVSHLTEKKCKGINEERSLEILPNDTFKKLKKQQDHIMYAPQLVKLILLHKKKLRYYQTTVYLEKVSQISGVTQMVG